MRCGGHFDVDRKRQRVELIERESVQPGFWDDQKRAQQLSKEKSGLELSIGQFDGEKKRVDDAVALWELAEEANDQATREEAKVAAGEAALGLQRLELARMLSG
ncbi:MAG: PCRF domain-containing protein, partial [Deltaproteobacteria bacterium]|nr:PCRF domain-containing protein [Deltaproteobacteria bacterium]